MADDSWENSWCMDHSDDILIDENALRSIHSLNTEDGSAKSELIQEDVDEKENIPPVINLTGGECAQKRKPLYENKSNGGVLQMLKNCPFYDSDEYLSPLDDFVTIDQIKSSSGFGHLAEYFSHVFGNGEKRETKKKSKMTAERRGVRNENGSEAPDGYFTQSKRGIAKKFRRMQTESKLSTRSVLL